MEGELGLWQVEGSSARVEEVSAVAFSSRVRGIGMRDDQWVVAALVDVLAAEFVEDGREFIEIEAVSAKVFATLRPSETPEAEMSVLLVVRAAAERLATACAGVFRYEEGRLLLTEAALRRPSSVSEALSGWWTRPSRLVKPPVSPSPTAPEAGPVEPEAGNDPLTDFFEGFEREIMQARLGNEGNPGRG